MLNIRGKLTILKKKSKLKTKQNKHHFKTAKNTLYDVFQGRKEMFYLMTHSHFTVKWYQIMVKDNLQEEIHCCYMAYYFQLAARFFYMNHPR